MIKITKKSPSYCRFQINLGLSGDGHWAEREKIINDGKRNAGVTDKVINSIIALHPADSTDRFVESVMKRIFNC